LSCYNLVMNTELPVIYIVDDDLSILNSIDMLLASENWEVRCLTRASMFLDSFDAIRAGCLVLDLQMPDMSGLELQKTLKDWDVDIPIIFITGTDSVSSTVMALKSGRLMSGSQISPTASGRFSPAWCLGQ